jgi:hypothetical protein
MAGMWELPEIRAWGKQIPPGLTPDRNDKGESDGGSDRTARIESKQIPLGPRPNRNDKTERMNGNDKSWMELRHSITMTDYLVRVEKGFGPEDVDGQWVKKSRIPSLPLTGLARKILRKAEII